MKYPNRLRSKEDIDRDLAEERASWGGGGATLRDDAWAQVGYCARLEDHLADARCEVKKLCDP